MFLDPLIPYLEPPELRVWPAAGLVIKPFGVLVASGVWAGTWLALRQARRLGVDRTALLACILCVMVTGFACAHVFDVLWYTPHRALRDPWVLLHMADGLSSFGGFLGAVLGGLLFKWLTRSPLLPYADLMSYGFPVGWLFGRAGCTLAHDHPGLLTDVWFAVQYPDGGRLDLGLLELVCTIPLAVAFLALRRRPRPWGFYSGLLMTSYAPVRFALDFLRAPSLPGELGSIDPRYFALTPAQWGCLAALPAGVALLWRALARVNEPDATRPPAWPARR